MDSSPSQFILTISVLLLILNEYFSCADNSTQKAKCPACHRTLASAASLARHRENYCRYRHGKKAKQPVVARQRQVVEIEDDDYEVWSENDNFISLSKVNASGRVRDYEMKSSEDVCDAERWLLSEEALVRKVFERMDEFLVRGRLVL